MNKTKELVGNNQGKTHESQAKSMVYSLATLQHIFIVDNVE